MKVFEIRRVLENIFKKLTHCCDATFFVRLGVLVSGAVSDSRRGDAMVISDTSCDTTLLHSTNSRLYMSKNSSKSMSVMCNDKSVKCKSHRLITSFSAKLIKERDLTAKLVDFLSKMQGGLSFVS